jgi:hypothetical protein
MAKMGPRQEAQKVNYEPQALLLSQNSADIIARAILQPKIEVQIFQMKTNLMGYLTHVDVGDLLLVK